MEEIKTRRESFSKEEKKLCKESFGKDIERKLSHKPDISVHKCEEEIAFYNAQTEKFFQEERGLVGEGLNPKLAANIAFITNADVEDLFGKCTKLRTTNSFLNPDSRKDLMELYSKIYGSQTVTNNEFAGWMVKGYIANLKKKKVNWALAAWTTALEKADRAQRLLFRLSDPDNEDATIVGGSLSGCTSQRGSLGFRAMGAMVKIEGAKGSPRCARPRDSVNNLCPYGVSLSDIEQVREVVETESELLVIATSKVTYVEAEYKKISDKLVGLKFNMDDRHSAAKEDGDKVLELQVQFDCAAKAILEYEMQAIGISVSSLEHEEFERNLGVLTDKKHSLERKLDICQSMAEASRERAIKGEDLYQDFEIEQFKAESDLQILRREIFEMKRHIAVVEEQQVEMKKGSGLSLWPKPALHPTMANDLDLDSPTLQLHPCVFCNRGYPYYDIVVASCRHIYHVFCASALAKVDNKCTRCAEVFHPHWWQNFGFGGAYTGFEDENGRLELPTKLGELKQSLKEDGSLHVLNWSRSSVKHSDWGSSGSIPRYCDPMSGGLSTTIGGKNMEHPLSSSIPLQEQNKSDPNPGILSSRGQEVDSPIKTDEVKFGTIQSQDATLVNPVQVNMNPGSVLAVEVIESDKSEPSNESQHFNMPKQRHSYLKRAADLPCNDGVGRKKLALNSIGEENALMLGDTIPNVELDGEARPESRAINSAHGKGKMKPKVTKQKASEQLPLLSVGRVATRAGTKKK